MTRFLLLTAVSIIIGVGAFSQQQINNPGFETWEDVGVGTDEPTHWNSIKTGDNPTLNQMAPVVWEKSTDAHSGQYSLKLFNVSTFGIVATGTVTNGQVHADFNPNLGYVFTNVENDLFHTAFDQRPDSLTGWFKCNPAEGDFGTVKFVLHKGYLKLPGDEANLIATAYYELPHVVVTTWTRFSVPFNYVSEETPEYFLSVITSGNGVDALDESEVWYDDFAFVYKSSNIDENSIHYFFASQYGNTLHVQLDKFPARYYQLSILNTNGQVIFNQKAESGNRIEINTDQINSGLYIMVAQYNNRVITRKIILH
ncbi:MAG: T9SS type A sorting domain-containing protein [Bacteroidetes bacterium]|nr:T9SS type A sorting domain-containing protein [Bacteroidota bacterium]